MVQNKMKANKIIQKLPAYARMTMIPVGLYLVLLLMIPSRMASMQVVISMITSCVISTITAYGVAFGIVCGILDFSMGSRTVIAGICAAAAGWYLGLPGMIVTALAVSVLLAALVGGLFARLKIPSVVVSIGSLMVLEMVGLWIIGVLKDVNPAISTGQYVRTPQSLVFLGTVPWNYIILIAMAVLFYLINDHLTIANQARMIGSDELIARNIGIKPMKVKFRTYLLSSVFLAVAAIVSACYSSAVGYKSEMSSMSMAFKPIMAVIVGMSLAKAGVNNVYGIFLGSLSIQVIFTGIIALGWSDSLQNVVLGIFMLAILTFPTAKKAIGDYRRRREAKKEFAAADQSIE